MPTIPDPRSFRRADLASNIMIFDRAILDADVLDLADILRQSLQAVFVESDSVFRFRINPDLLEVENEKITSDTLTQAGYETSHFGNNWTRMNFSGSTGFFRSAHLVEMGIKLVGLRDGEQRRAAFEQAVLSGKIDITKSPVWQKWRRFTEFYRRLKGESVLYYDLSIMTGTLKNLRWTQDANNPFQMRYKFTFQAHTDAASGTDRLGRAIRYIGSKTGSAF